MAALRRSGVLRAVGAWDVRVFRGTARRESPLLDRVLPALSRAADYGALWTGLSGVLVATRRRRLRRAGVRGLSSIAVTSLLVNQVGKRLWPRARPALDRVPIARVARRVPRSGSFPSGHAASATAFAVGASIEAPVLAPPLGALAAAVAYSRVYTGVHYPSDVAVGALVGAAVALAGARLVPPGAPSPVQATEPLADRQRARADGAGVVAVVNPRAGSGRGARLLELLPRELPKAEVVEWREGTSLPDLLRDAAGRAEVLAVGGGDGTVNAAGQVAMDAGLPLLVLPGGTFNHFADSLGIDRVSDAIQAVRDGSAVRVDVGTAADRLFLNTASLGAYPAFVAARERWEPRLGKGLAAALAVLKVLRTERPVRAVVDGRERSIGMLFVGNGRYQPPGLLPAWRERLDDGRLDVRLLESRRRVAPLRLLTAFLTGRLGQSRVYAVHDRGDLHVSVRDGPTTLARDGEIGPGPSEVHFAKQRRALTVYRPPGGLLL